MRYIELNNYFPMITRPHKNNVGFWFRILFCSILIIHTSFCFLVRLPKMWAMVVNKLHNTIKTNALKITIFILKMSLPQLMFLYSTLYKYNILLIKNFYLVLALPNREYFYTFYSFIYAKINITIHKHTHTCTNTLEHSLRRESSAIGILSAYEKTQKKNPRVLWPQFFQ